MQTRSALMNFNLALSVYLHAKNRPRSTAISCEERVLTYAEVAHKAAAVCHTLLQLPVRADGRTMRVGILASRSIDACLGVLGACWAGATYIPINLNLPESRLLSILAICDLDAVIVGSSAQLLTQSVRAACPPLVISDVESLPIAPVTEPMQVGPEHPAYTIFTSGTTGAPKGVVVSARAIRHYTETAAAYLGLLPSDRALESCELSFDFSVNNMFTTWCAGASLHILRTVRAMGAVKFVNSNQITVWYSVPSLAGRLIQIKSLGANTLPTLRITLFGGEQLPVAIVDAWRLAAPNSVIENFYGPTEVTVFCLAQRVGVPTPVSPGRDVVSIGTPLAHNEAAILDPNGGRAARGTAGELAIAGAQLAIGYLKADDLTAARFPVIDKKRWYLTGDLAFEDVHGNFHHLGRTDNQVKVLGHRIELEELDSCLRASAGTSSVAVVAWPFVNGTAQGLVAFIAGQNINAREVIDAMKQKLPIYAVPTRFITLSELPLSSSGKIDRIALRAQLDREAV